MSDRTSTIALMAHDRRESDHLHHPSSLMLDEAYIAEAISFYQLTERMVTEAYRTTSTPLTNDTVGL